MTASDFHRALRNIYDKQSVGFGQLQLDDLTLQLNIDKEIASQHLDTLETLDLITFHDTERKLFSLTESGRLANLP
ncbi:MAG TPA: hypothetical protein PL009_13765 [Flavipsychrobacter sp.]|nr:hypothetical protein [Flavipsychrobacter sp.]